jgi:hypothetical protein
MNLDEERFSVLSLRDIRHEKRRRTLERIFFHDVLNTATGLLGFSELLPELEAEPDRLR